MSDTKTLIELIDEYAETRHRCECATYNAKTEAARKAVIEALSVVQALSAAQAVLHEPTNEMYRAAQKIALPYDDDGGTIILNTSQIRAIWHSMLAASPTPPAEQAAPKAAPVVKLSNEQVSRVIDVVVERSISLTQDATGIKIAYDPYILAVALAEAIGKQQAAPQQGVPEGSLRCDALQTLSYCHGMKAGWNFCVADDEDGYARAMGQTAEALNVLKTAPQPAPASNESAYQRGYMDGMAKGRRDAEAAPQPAPAGQQVASSAVLKAIREANMQLVRTGDDAFMLVPYKVATTEAVTYKAGATTGAASVVTPYAVYAPMPRAAYIEFDGREETAWHTPDQMRDFADRTHALRMEQAAPKAAPAGFVPVAAFNRLHAHAESLAARLLAAEQAAPKAAPVVWLSSKQLRGVTALHGQYLPFRCQPEGRFDTPVYLVEAAPKAAPGEPVHGDVLPPVGSRVYIRHGRDNDAHACTVTGYYAWGDLGGDKRLHRVFVRLVYEGTDRQQARMLCDCYPTAEAALAEAAPQQEAQEPGEIDRLRAALVYTAFALHGTPQYMLADGITLIDGDTVQVSRDGWKVQASANPLRQSAQPAPAPLSDDTKRLDWLNRNIFCREMSEWDAKYGHGPDYNMWVVFSPKGVQGSARNIIDAAIAAQRDTP